MRIKTALIFSGTIWFAAGCSLLLKGIPLLILSAYQETASLLLKSLSPIAGGSQQAALIILVFALFLGFIKGKYVLAKTADRVIKRLYVLPPSFKFFQVYSKQYYILILSMIGLGVCMNVFGLHSDLRGCIDVAIGSALVNSSLIYFRQLFIRDCR